MNSLSEMGRVEFLHSSVIPQVFYWFKVMKFPRTVIRQMEQSSRNYLQKGKLDKAIQVAWREVCQPKGSEGLGLVPLT